MIVLCTVVIFFAAGYVLGTFKEKRKSDRKFAAIIAARLLRSPTVLSSSDQANLANPSQQVITSQQSNLGIFLGIVGLRNGQSFRGGTELQNPIMYAKDDCE